MTDTQYLQYDYIIRALFLAFSTKEKFSPLACPVWTNTI